MRAQHLVDHQRSSSLGSLIDVFRSTGEKETSAAPQDVRGIDLVLTMASNLTGKRIALVKHLETDLRAAKGGENLNL